LILGLLFCVFQILGWLDLINRGLPFVNARSEDISASYVWAITFVHALHAVGGIVLVSVAFVKSLRYEIHKKTAHTDESCPHLLAFCGFAMDLFVFIPLFRRVKFNNG